MPKTKWRFAQFTFKKPQSCILGLSLCLGPSDPVSISHQLNSQLYRCIFSDWSRGNYVRRNRKFFRYQYGHYDYQT